MTSRRRYAALTSLEEASQAEIKRLAELQAAANRREQALTKSISRLEARPDRADELEETKKALEETRSTYKNDADRARQEVRDRLAGLEAAAADAQADVYRQQRNAEALRGQQQPLRGQQHNH